MMIWEIVNVFVKEYVSFCEGIVMWIYLRVF
jgi:hypothetical protein